MLRSPVPGSSVQPKLEGGVLLRVHGETLGEDLKSKAIEILVDEIV